MTSQALESSAKERIVVSYRLQFIIIEVPTFLDVLPEFAAVPQGLPAPGCWDDPLIETPAQAWATPPAGTGDTLCTPSASEAEMVLSELAGHGEVRGGGGNDEREENEFVNEAGGTGEGVTGGPSLAVLAYLFLGGAVFLCGARSSFTMVPPVPASLPRVLRKDTKAYKNDVPKAIDEKVAPILPPTFPDPEVRMRMLREEFWGHDRDGDGLISPVELLQWLGVDEQLRGEYVLEHEFQLRDHSRDGALSGDEVEGYLEDLLMREVDEPG